MPIKKLIRTIPDFPKPGIMFRDVTTLFQDPEGFRTVIEILRERYADQEIDAVVGVESRGFIVGAPLALALGCAFIPMRKPGKLPAATHSETYELEYTLMPSSRASVYSSLTICSGLAALLAQQRDWSSIARASLSRLRSSSTCLTSRGTRSLRMTAFRCSRSASSRATKQRGAHAAPARCTRVRARRWPGRRQLPR